jgi:hypothetical protein
MRSASAAASAASCVRQMPRRSIRLASRKWCSAPVPTAKARRHRQAFFGHAGQAQALAADLLRAEPGAGLQAVDPLGPFGRRLRGHRRLGNGK